MRLVLDTDVVVAALRSPTGASAAVLRAIRRGRGVMLLSVPLLIEYEAICQLAEHRLAAGLDETEVEAFLDGLVFLAQPVETHYRWRPQLRDPGDEMVLETAVNGQAQAIVTFNRRDYGDRPGTFGIEVLRPGETLRRMQE
jgi:putative PIN family toxin of toxin-antitoxin system